MCSFDHDCGDGQIKEVLQSLEFKLEPENAGKWLYFPLGLFAMSDGKCHLNI